MPPPYALMALLAAEESDDTCARCKKPLRSAGRWLLDREQDKILCFCDRRWCLFVRWLKRKLGRA